MTPWRHLVISLVCFPPLVLASPVGSPITSAASTDDGGFDSIAAGGAKGGTMVPGQAGQSTAHYVVFEMEEAGSLRAVHSQIVRLATPLVSLTPAAFESQMGTQMRESEAIPFRLETAGGQVVYLGVGEVSRWLRGEFHGAGPDAAIDGHLMPVKKRSFVARVPAVPGTSLVLTVDGIDKRFEVGNLPVSEGGVRGDRGVVGTSEALGDPGNRVDLLVLGDGYTAAQAGKFTSDAAGVMADFFGITPYSEYANYVNVHTLFVPSNESGADHPPYMPSCPAGDSSCCGDPAMQFDPLRGTFVATAFSALFCTYNIHRLLTVEPTSVFAAAAAVPDWDQIMVIVNDSTYGGSGGQFAVLSTNLAAVDVAQHEYGHTFTRLADEYDSPYPGYPACSDITSPACEPNVTDQSTRALIKWLPWIAPGTPTPTPEGVFEYLNVPGLFEGARYLPTGMYRAGDECMMRYLGTPFCDVASQAYVLRLYGGGWGVPFDGIDPIEPGSESPAPNQVVYAEFPSTVSISAGLLQPIGGPPLEVNWYVNGVLAAGQHSGLYQLSASGAGAIVVRLEVTDATALVHPAMAGTLLQSSREWTLTDPDDDNDGVCDQGGPLPNGTPGTPAGGCAAGPTGADNCPGFVNAAQANADGDAVGDACDACPATADPSACPDDDNDGFSDVNEGGTPLCGANVNNDTFDAANADTRVNDGCPALGPAETACTDALDNDGDGAFNDGCPVFGSFSEGQFKLGTGPLDPCGISGWPLDLVSTGISANRFDIVDLASFVTPVRRIDKNPGELGFGSRWDLVPGSSTAKFINVADMGATVTQATGSPPMLGRLKAIGRGCPFPP